MVGKLAEDYHVTLYARHRRHAGVKWHGRRQCSRRCQLPETATKVKRSKRPSCQVLAGGIIPAVVVIEVPRRPCSNNARSNVSGRSQPLPANA